MALNDAACARGLFVCVIRVTYRLKSAEHGKAIAEMEAEIRVADPATAETLRKMLQKMSR